MMRKAHGYVYIARGMRIYVRRSLIEEVQVVKRYLLKHQSDRFEKGDAADELLFKRPVDAVIMSSIVKDSFFLTTGEKGTLEELHPDLSRGLASMGRRLHGSAPRHL